MEINEVAETDNGELVVDATNGAPPPQDAMTTTTAYSDLCKPLYTAGGNVVDGCLDDDIEMIHN